MEMATKTPVSVEVGQAYLRLVQFIGRANLIDHGYSVSDDIRLLLNQFEVVIYPPTPGSIVIPADKAG